VATTPSTTFDFANGVRVEDAAPPVNSKRLHARARLNAATRAEGCLIENNIRERMADINANNALSLHVNGNATVDGFIVDSGKRNAVDPLLLYSIMHQRNRRSSAMRFPERRERSNATHAANRATVWRFKDLGPQQKHRKGAALHASSLLDQFGDVQLALAGLQRQARVRW
jgi:hypothetical protein